MSPTQWVALLLTVLAVLFVFDNRATVTVEFLLISVQSPMWLILLVMFVLGWIIGVLMMRKRRH